MLDGSWNSDHMASPQISGVIGHVPPSPYTALTSRSTHTMRCSMLSDMLLRDLTGG